MFRPALPPAWMRRLDSLRVKLFVAIAGANVVLVAAAYVIYGWSFDQGLVEYLNRADEARLTPLVNRLAEGHRLHGNWDWVRDDRQHWHDLLREVLGVGRSGRRADRTAESDPRRPSPEAAPASGARAGSAAVASVASSEPRPVAQAASMPSPPLTIDPRLLLLDAQGRVLIGPEERRAQAVVRPIHDGGVVVGHLGYIPRLQMVASLEQVFVQQQNRKFAAIALGLLLAVLLNAAWISRWLTRRLREVSEGAAAVAHGHYGVRVAVQGHDELAQLAADFNHMAVSLQTAQRSREQWVADIAHELRTPLTSLKVEIEALVDGVRQPDARNLASLAQEVERLNRLVEDLRVLSLSDSGALVHRFEHVDLSDHVEQVLAEARQGRTAGVELVLDLAAEQWIHADPDRLDQVLRNLLQNTLRYTHPPIRLRVAVHADGPDVRLEWEDSAPGVPAESLPRLTERLFRLDDSRARSSGGSGLGLAIVKALVQGHGGRLEASASPLGGLRWTLWFPRIDGPEHD